MINLNRNSHTDYWASVDAHGEFVNTLEAALQVLRDGRTDEKHVYLWRMHDGTPSVIALTTQESRQSPSRDPYIGEFQPPELWDILESYARML